MQAKAARMSIDRPAPSVTIAGRTIGPQFPVFFIAEAGVNHNGSVSMAKELIEAAAHAGADAVKFQTFAAARLATPKAPKANYQLQSTPLEESQFEMLSKLELSENDFADLMRYSQKKGILFLSTPFDEESADLLERLGVAAFKIPSGEITNSPFLVHIANKKKPMILSTGMSFLEEVTAAVRAVQETGLQELILLHCVSSYPAKIEEVNLRAMKTLEDTFGLPVGYSDHTLGSEASLAAVALGACVIEKHFTLDKTLPGPDQRASMEPGELKNLVESVRKVESSLGTGAKAPVPCEENTRQVARKSLTLAQTISKGAVLEKSMLCSLRPGTGIAPAFLNKVLGRHVKRTMKQGEQITWEELV